MEEMPSGREESRSGDRDRSRLRVDGIVERRVGCLAVLFLQGFAQI